MDGTRLRAVTHFGVQARALPVGLHLSLLVRLMILPSKGEHKIPTEWGDISLFHIERRGFGTDSIRSSYSR